MGIKDEDEANSDDDDDEEYDEDDEKPKIENILDQLNAEQLTKILNVDLKKLYKKGDIKGAMKFVNELPIESRYDLITAIDFEQTQIEKKLTKPGLKATAKARQVYDGKI